MYIYTHCTHAEHASYVSVSLHIPEVKTQSTQSKELEVVNDLIFQRLVTVFSAVVDAAVFSNVRLLLPALT